MLEGHLKLALFYVMYPTVLVVNTCECVMCLCVCDQTDVSGQCSSDYSVHEKGWRSTTVKRSRDLSQCSQRPSDVTGLQSGPLASSTLPSGPRALPLLNSSHECQQTVDRNGVLTSATCSETHQFRPFASQASGATTKVTQALKFKATSRDIFPVHGQSLETAVTT